jgi:hypothetical protein
MQLPEAVLLASLAAGAAAAAILLVLAAGGGEEHEQPLPEEPPPEPEGLGAGAATGAAGGGGGWVLELLGEALPGGGEASRPLADDAVASRLLLVLEEARSVPLEELELRVGASREAIARAVEELRRRGLVRVEGGVVMFSEHGEKLITKLREKYFEKKRWLETI